MHPSTTSETGVQSASIDHGRRFYCANGALWLIQFNRICFGGLSGCWGWGTVSSAKVLHIARRSCFRGAAAARLDSATRAVATVLVAAIGIAVDDADGGAEGIIY